MKQIIVMSAMVLLGIFIAGMIFSFQDSAQELSDGTIGAMQKLQTKVDEAAKP